MADIYIESTTGSDADSGATRALAKATAAGAAAIDVAGDNLNFSSVHAESSASTITIALAGTAANPVKMLSVAFDAEPPTTLTAGASVTATGTSNITISGHCYVHGMSFTAGALVNMCSGGVAQVYENCKFKTTNTGSGGGFSMTQNNTLTKLTHRNCTYYFTATSNKFTVQHSAYIQGASMESGSATPTAFLTIGADGRGGHWVVEDFNFSGFGAGMHLVASTMPASGRVEFRNGRLPTSWTGDLTGGAMAAPGLRVVMYNCDSGDTNYRLRVKDFSGEARDETTLVKTGGSSDGTTTYSIKVTTNASANFTTGLFYSEPITRWNTTVGSAITVGIDILHDSATPLTDGEVWIEVHYLGTSGFPVGSVITDAKANILATAANQASSSVTWTTTGMTNPNKQRLSVTFTPQEVGPWVAYVVSAKPSYTFYYDNDPVIS